MSLVDRLPRARERFAGGMVTFTGDAPLNLRRHFGPAHVLPCSLCGRKPRALSGRELHCLDCIKRVEDEEASL